MDDVNAVNLYKIFVHDGKLETVVLPAVKKKSSYAVNSPKETRRKIIYERDIMKVEVFEEGEFCYILCKEEDQEEATRMLLSVTLERMKIYDKRLLHRLEKSDFFKVQLTQLQESTG